METLPCRIVVYVKDVMNITGRSERYARNLLAAIRVAYKKDSHALVIIDEFCAYTGIPEERVRPFLL